MRRRTFISLMAMTLVLFVTVGFADEPIRIACIGDSITFGHGIKDRDKNSFPAQLGAMLGKGYEVKNFGVNASTLLKKGNKPYWGLNQFQAAQDCKPNIVIIKLGTNDTKPGNWKHKAEFESDYIEMVRTFQALESKPDVWICYPIPVFPARWGINDKTVKGEVIPLIDKVAQKTGAKVIDLYKPLVGKSQLVPDKVHPNAAGAKIIAETIFAELTGKAAKKTAGKEPILIMPAGDSITTGYTDNPKWEHPFEFGYRSGLYSRLKEADCNFTFVGQCKEPFNNRFGDPTRGGTVTPKLDLRKVGQDGHRGYGGWQIVSIQRYIAQWIREDKPDIILLLIGINGISARSPEQLDALVKTIYSADKDVELIVAQITPRSRFLKVLLDYNTYIRNTLVPKYAGEGRAISTVDLYTLFLKDPKDPESIDPIRLSNGINHPTNEMYDKMAQVWFEGIKEVLNKQRKPKAKD